MLRIKTCCYAALNANLSAFAARLNASEIFSVAIAEFFAKSAEEMPDNRKFNAGRFPILRISRGRDVPSDNRPFPQNAHDVRAVRIKRGRRPAIGVPVLVNRVLRRARTILRRIERGARGLPARSDNRVWRSDRVFRRMFHYESVGSNGASVC